MTLNIPVIRKLREIVGPERVLTDPEDLYVYSFEKIFEDAKHSDFDAVVKATSTDEIAKIEKLAETEGFTILRRGENAVHDPQKTKRSATVILDTLPHPELTAFDKKLGEKFQQFRERRQKLMDAMLRERSYKGLASVIGSLFQDKIIQQCRDCEACTGYCTVSPIFNHVETYSSKGRYLLTRGLMTEEIKPSKRLADILYSCTLCGLCYFQCTSNLHLYEVILEARRRMIEKGLAPESGKATLKNIIEHGNPIGASKKLRARWMERVPKDSLREKADVLYWAGCNTVLRSGVRPTAKSTVNVLNAAGVGVMTLGDREGCCGFSLVAEGFFEEAKRNAERIILVVDEAGVETLVTSCSGCYETFVDFYPNKLGVEMPCQVLHSSQLMAHLVKNGDLALNKLPMRVSYHDSCGLGRHCGVYEPPRKLLKAIPDLQLIEPKMSREHSRCCGGGGGFWSVNSRASMSLAHLRIEEDIMPLKVKALAVTCPLCYTNFLYTVRRHTINIKVYDLMEIVEMALRGERKFDQPWDKRSSLE
ncbi:MAG: heterodisulfide reductase-related iron-sulfur binding cluster [Candidatus Bathyarchaeia archaeon]